MKHLKRLIPILLCLVMVAGLFPITASAASPYTTLVLNVTGITIPKEGDTPVTSFDGIDLGSEDVTIDTSYAIHWYEEGNSSTPYTDAFCTTSYYIDIVFKSAKPGSWYIANSTQVTATAEGSTKIEYEFDNQSRAHLRIYYYAYRHFGPQANSPVVDVEPATLSYGMKAGDITVARTSTPGGFEVQSVEVYNSATNNKLNATDSLQLGQSYYLKFRLATKSLAYFDDDLRLDIYCGGKVYYFAAAPINGVVNHQYADFKFDRWGTVKKTVSTLSVTGINEPAAGPQQTTGFATGTEGVQLSYANWYEKTASSYTIVNGDLESGRTYYLFLNVNVTDETKYQLDLTKEAVTVNNGTVETYTQNSQTAGVVVIKVEIPGSIQGHDLGDRTMDLTQGPVVWNPSGNEEDMRVGLELDLMALNGEINITSENDTHYIDLDKDGSNDVRIYQEGSAQYIDVDPDTNLSGTYVCQPSEAVISYIRDNGLDYYSTITFNFPRVAVDLGSIIVDLRAASYSTDDAGINVLLNAMRNRGQITLKLFNGQEFRFDLDKDGTYDLSYKFTTDSTTSTYSALSTASVKGFVTLTPNEDALADLVAGGSDYYSSVTLIFPGLVNPFTDVREKDYFYDPVLWAYYHVPQITNGTSATTFSPNKECTRCQIVTFLWRAAGEPEPTVTENPFTDVRTKDYFYKAVLWAVEKNITNGMDATHFKPSKTCTRGQIATFLYRAYV